MELDKRDPGDVQRLLELRDRVGELRQTLGEGEDVPRIDLLDFGDAFELVVEVPGVSQRDLEVAVQGRSVTVAGRRAAREEHADVLLAERPGGHFQRTVTLPGEVAEERGSAHLREGLLRLHLPKR